VDVTRVGRVVFLQLRLVLRRWALAQLPVAMDGVHVVHQLALRDVPQRAGCCETPLNRLGMDFETSIGYLSRIIATLLLSVRKLWSPVSPS
jgi:hypothetical protein